MKVTDGAGRGHCFFPSNKLMGFVRILGEQWGRVADVSVISDESFTVLKTVSSPLDRQEGASVVFRVHGDMTG